MTLSSEQITPRKIKVMLIDDSAILLREVLPFLTEHSTIDLVGSIYKTTKAVEQVRVLKPDVVLLDVTIRGLLELPLIPQLHAVRPALAVIVLDEIELFSVKRAALAHGAADFVTKPCASTRLLPAILRVAHIPQIDA